MLHLCDAEPPTYLLIFAGQAYLGFYFSNLPEFYISFVRPIVRPIAIYLAFIVITQKRIHSLFARQVQSKVKKH